MSKLNTINIHFLDACNFACKHCFVKKENHQLSYNQITKIIDKIKEYFLEQNIIDGRINLAGGEPLLSKDIDKIINYISASGIKVSLITNGFYLTKEFIERHHHHLSCIGISIDSLITKTNQVIGRCQKDGKTLDISNLIEICKCIKSAGIKLKINTCLSKLNYKEDFTTFLEAVKPDRYKVLQMTCEDYDILNARNRISNIEMNDFCTRHKKYITVKETADELKKSYVIVDSCGNLSYDNTHELSYSVFDNKISDILLKLEINELNFERRYNNEYQQSIINS